MESIYLATSITLDRGVEEMYKVGKDMNDDFHMRSEQRSKMLK